MRSPMTRQALVRMLTVSRVDPFPARGPHAHGHRRIDDEGSLKDEPGPQAQRTVAASRKRRERERESQEPAPGISQKYPRRRPVPQQKSAGGACYGIEHPSFRARGWAGSEQQGAHGYKQRLLARQ